MSEKKPYQVLARKYRPMTFEEMVGQKAVVQTLQNAITSNRVGQAYLFSGTRGVGKTTAARILAKALNCAHGPTPTPCNACEFCLEINGDHSVDYMEIDGASNRGIDDIRNLRELVKYKAMRSRTKIITIDEVHQITKDGFNALLKTLEEPPENTVFIFATTEFTKVPATIVSRCQHFEFRRVSGRDIIDHLAFVARKEGLTVSPFGLGLLASAADGSVRDALSLLDQAVAFCGETVDDDALREILGTVNRELLFEFSSAILGGRSDEVFPLVEKVFDSGYDFRAFGKELIQHFRNLLLVRSMPRAEDVLLFDADEMNRLRAEAQKATDEELLRYLQALQAGEAGLRFSSDPQIALEILLVKLCHFGKLVPIKDLLREFEPMKKAGQIPPPAPSRPSSPVASPPPAFPKPAPAGEKAPAFPRAAPASERPVSRPTGRPAVPPETPRPAPAGPPRRDAETAAAVQDSNVQMFLRAMKGRVVSVEPMKGLRNGEEE
ncbi:MAG: DNA polymerase III subunit gamma/tau [Candidatus Aminicenantes bacterium]|nr:DNA polymerase III subunit gamma/tau [Candidatus Aminicenantes bacterium]